MRHIELNEMQQKAYAAALAGNSIFITGIAGSGKSVVIQQIVRELSRKKYVALTSTTGMSANVIGGVTLHSYLGIRLGTGSVSKLHSIIKKSTKYLNRWRRVNVLIIDEISMLSRELFEKLEQLARIIRDNNAPFGGIQLIISGDFLQLKPVKSDDFCFESPVWDECIQTYVCLTESMRHDNAMFSQILNGIRLGVVDDEAKRVIESRCVKYKNINGIVPTILYATNAKVNKKNKQQYDKLVGDEMSYCTQYNWCVNVYNKEKYENNMLGPHEIKLKIGAQVMYLVNKNELFNGSRGVVVDFVEGLPQVRFKHSTKIIDHETLSIEEGDQVILEYTQLPLKLAWSATIHKSQGTTLDLVRINFRNIFEDGQFYVALSRVRTLDGLYLKNLDWNLLKVNAKALQFYKKIALLG